MNKEQVKKCITKAVNKACGDETQAVKDYLVKITTLTYEGLESDKKACHDNGKPYTSKENLKYAISINLEDELGYLIDEAKKVIKEREQREADEESERKYMIENAKKELTFYNALVNDWKTYQKEQFDKMVEWFEYRGLEKNEDTIDEFDTTNKNGEKEHRKQVDFLGTFCGFTLQEVNGETMIGYAWVFDNSNTQLDITDEGNVVVHSF